MKLNNIDLNKMRVFHEVVRSGTYQLASEELGLTKSAISQSLSTLESQLGVKLFLRKGRKLFPTDEAKTLAQEFAIYQQSLNQAIQKLTGKQRQVEGLIRIGSYYEFAKYKLIHRINKFSQTYPNSKFKFTFDSPSRLQQNLEKGIIDLSFSIFPHTGSKEIESVKVFEQELVLIAPTAMAPMIKTPDDLKKRPIIEYYKTHQLLPRWIKSHFSVTRKKMTPRFYAASAEMLYELVGLGLGVGVVPAYILAANPKRGVKVVRPTDKRIIDYIWMNQYIDQFENAAHRQFSESIKETL